MVAGSLPALGQDQATRTGAFQLTYTMAELVGPESAARFDSIIPEDEAISWEVFVSGNIPRKGFLRYFGAQM